MPSYEPPGFFSRLPSGSNYRPRRPETWEDRAAALEKHRLERFRAERTAAEVAAMYALHQRAAMGVPEPAPERPPLKPAERVTGGYQPPLSVQVAQAAAVDPSGRRPFEPRDLELLLDRVARKNGRYSFRGARTLALVSIVATTGWPLAKVLALSADQVRQLRLPRALAEHASWFLRKRDRAGVGRTETALCTAGGGRWDPRNCRRELHRVARRAGFAKLTARQLRDCSREVRKLPAIRVPARAPRARPRVLS